MPCTLVTRRPAYLHGLELKPFDDPLSDRSSYWQYLLHLDKPLVPASDLSEDEVDDFFKELIRRWAAFPPT